MGSSEETTIEEKRENVPKLRFPGFTDAWEQRKLGDILTERHILSKICDDYPRLSFTIEEGVIAPENRKTNKRDFLMKDEANKKFLLTELDDIIYNPANVVFGAIHRNSYGKGCLSPIYRIFETDQNARFLECVVRSETFIKKLAQKTEGSVVKLKTLKPESFLEMSVFISTIPEEQEKIASCIDTIDNLITLQQRKCDEIKNLKKCMLQKMFPKEGEQFPEIRFPEFTDAWEQRKLAEVSDVRDGTHDSPSYLSEGHPFVTSKNVKDGYINYDDIQYISDEDFEAINKRSKVDVNDILMGMIGTIGNLALIRTEPDFAIKNVALIKDTKQISHLYLYHYLQSPSTEKQLLSGLDGGTQKFVSLKNIRELNVIMPSEAEQQKVGDFFESIDNLITLHQRKLDDIKELKKALLQQMFV